MTETIDVRLALLVAAATFGYLGAIVIALKSWKLHPVASTAFLKELGFSSLLVGLLAEIRNYPLSLIFGTVGATLASICAVGGRELVLLIGEGARANALTRTRTVAMIITGGTAFMLSLWLGWPLLEAGD